MICCCQVSTVSGAEDPIKALSSFLIARNSNNFYPIPIFESPYNFNGGRYNPIPNHEDIYDLVFLLRRFGALTLKDANHVLGGVYRHILSKLESQHGLDKFQFELFAQLIRTGGSQNLIHSLDQLYLAQNRHLKFQTDFLCI